MKTRYYLFLAATIVSSLAASDDGIALIRGKGLFVPVLDTFDTVLSLVFFMLAGTLCLLCARRTRKQIIAKERQDKPMSGTVLPTDLQIKVVILKIRGPIFAVHEFCFNLLDQLGYLGYMINKLDPETSEVGIFIPTDKEKAEVRDAAKEFVKATGLTLLD